MSGILRTPKPIIRIIIGIRAKKHKIRIQFFHPS